MTLTVKKVIHDDYYHNSTERAMRRVYYEAWILLGLLLSEINSDIFNYGLKELLQEPTDLKYMFIALILGVFLLIAGTEYLSGIVYIKKFNNAYENGIRYTGCPIIGYKERHSGYLMYNYYTFSALVRVTDNIEVFTPFYEDRVHFNDYCDVYYYKKKYYFCSFRKEKEESIKRGVHKSKFKSKFTARFIINTLWLSLVFTVIFRLVAAAAISSLEGASACLPIVLCRVLVIVFSMGTAVFLTQNYLAKKYCSYIPDVIEFYIGLAVIFTILVVIYTISDFSTLEEYCTNNISSLTVSEDDIHSAVKKSVIISDVIQAIIFAALIPFWKKRHDSLF